MRGASVYTYADPSAMITIHGVADLAVAGLLVFYSHRVGARRKTYGVIKLQVSLGVRVSSDYGFALRIDDFESDSSGCDSRPELDHQSWQLRREHEVELLDAMGVAEANVIRLG